LVWRRAATVDDIFGYGSGGSNSLSQNKLRKADDDNRDTTTAGFATCDYKCRICKKFVRKFEFHIHEVVSNNKGGRRGRHSSKIGVQRRKTIPNEPNNKKD